ncbi:MAG: HAD-IA family hydrolase [Candidatus Poribacteria bacterium]|nr:HAD-IA family hydrolase [Candidatus Poribacteria bacterium]
MLPSSLQLVMFDMAGTTVDDRVDGYPLMVISMMRAFAGQGIELTSDQINAHRGKQKLEAVRTLLKESVVSSSDDADCVAETIYRDFVRELQRNLSRISEIDGATDLFHFLRSRQIRVGVGSGFPTEIVEAIVSRLGWQDRGLLDYIGSAEQVGAGRPDPRMIHDAMQTLGITDSQRVLKIGDTVVDIQEGKNAGVWTIAVLTGSQTETQLMEAAPDYILPSIRNLPRLMMIEQ